MAITGNDLLEKSKKNKKKENEAVTGQDLINRLKTYQSADTSSVDQKYIDSFMTDANSFLTTAEKDYGGVGWANASSSYDSRSSTWKELSARADAIGAWLYKNRNSLDSDVYKTLSDSLSEIRGSGSSILNTFKSAVDHYSQWKTEDEYNAWYEDYQRKQEMASSAEGKQGWEKYLADQERAKSAKDDESFWEKIGRYLTEGGGVTDTTLPMGTTTATINALSNDDSYRLPQADWSEEQQRIFGYLYQTSPGEAYKYAISTNSQNKKAAEEEALKKIAESATSNFWAGARHTLGAIASAPLGLADYLSDLVSVNAGRPITSDGIISPFEYSQAVTGGITTKLNDMSGTIDDDVWMLGGKGLGDLYGLGTSIAQSMASAYTLGGTGTLISYFGQGAASGVDEALSRGASEGQALLYGTSLGVFEGLAEMVGIDNLFKLGSATTVKGFIKNILKQAGAEGMEEGLTAFLSNIADNAIMGDKSNFSFLVSQYMASGMSEEEAQKKAWLTTVGDIAFDTISGAASGSVSGGIHTSAQTIGANANANAEAMKLYGNGSELVTEALEINPDNKYAQKLKNKESLSGKNIRRLVEMNEKNLVTQDTAKMKSAVEARLKELGETGDISDLADVIVKARSGNKLTSAERATLTESKYGRRVSTEMNPDVMSDHSSAWAENIGTERINYDAYNKELLALANETAGVAEEKPAVAKVSAETPTNTSAEKETTTETSFKVSEDGKARLGDTEISIKEIASIKNGEVMLRLDDGSKDGSTVKASEVTFSSNEEGLLYENVVDMGLNAVTASTFVKGFDGSMSVGDYVQGFKNAYHYGEVGIPKKELSLDEFASRLTDSVRNLAYNHGSINAKYTATEQEKVNKSRPKVSAEKKPAYRTKYEKKGEIHNTDIEKSEVYKSLSKLQKDSIDGMVALYKALGIEVYFFESPTNAKGQRIGKKGYFVPEDGSVHIDLYAGDDGRGTILFTAGHELTHYIREKLPSQFKAFADILFDKLGQKRSVSELIAQKKSDLESIGRITPDMTEQEAYDLAYEETVADACESMLADGKAFAEVAQKVKAKNKSLWEAIKQFFTDLVAKIRKAYEGLNPDSIVGNQVAEMLKTAEELRSMWVDMLVEASGIENAVAEVVETDAKPISTDEIITDGAVVTDGKGKKYYIRSMKHDISNGQMFRDLMTHCGFTKEQVGTLRGQLEDLVEYMNPFRDIVDLNETYDMEGRRYAPYKPNSDPLYTISLDFSTQCSKRLLTQYVIEQLQLRENRPMSPEEQMAIRDMLKEYGKVEKGLQVACVMCYVEAARLKAPKQIQKWLDDPATAMRNFFADKNPEFSAYIKEKQADFKESKGYDRNATKKDMSAKDRTALNKIRPKVRAEYKPSAEEMAIIETASNLPNSTYLTAGNLADLSETHPEIYKAYTAFIRTATRSKALETDEPYYYGDSTRDNGNGIIVSDSFIESVNRENGMRFSSWSDWRIQHLLDWITAVIDNSVRGAAMHGYTKYGDEVRVLGKTGMMFNMSGVAGTQTGLNEDGSLSFSETESMDYDEAIALREEFPETAGLQCIGVGIDHIYALLRSDVIDYVIPYHTSGLNATLRRMGDIYGWKDFTQTQHATEDKSIKKENAVDPDNWHKEPVFSEFFVGYDTGLGGVEAMRKSAENYKRMCQERGLKPKFLEFANEPNYWKLLIDRKMVNQKTNTLIQQKAVTPTFDFGVIKGIVDKYVANYDSGLEQRAFNHIVENWDNIPKRIRDLKKQGGTKAKKTKKAVDKLANETVAVQPKKEKASDRIKASDRDSKGRMLSKGQQEFFKYSKVRDENGNLLVVYHGSPNDFTVFYGRGNSQFGAYKFLYHSVNYFTTSKETAEDFSRKKDYSFGNVYEGYVNITNPYVFKDENSSERGYSTANGLKNRELREFEVSLFKKSLNILKVADSAEEANELLLPFNARVKDYGKSEGGDRYELFVGGGNTLFAAENFVTSANDLWDLFSDEELLAREVIGVSEEYGDDDYYYTTDQVVNLVIAMNGENRTNYDGVIIDNIFDAMSFHGRVAKDIITIKSQDQFKSADNTNPTHDPDIRYSDRVLMGSLFSGGGTLEAGLAYQMLDKEFGVEYDGKIASVYADNHGDHIQVGKVEDFDISKYDDIFYLHASPVCHNFSKAKHGAKELQVDIDSAKATAKHLETAMPQVFTVENAPGYRKSASLKIITDKLTELGYKWDVDVYNSADYGSATSRNRVILRAVKDGELPAKPTKQERTNSWDKATRDLWDTLPKSYLRPSFISAIENTPKLPILDADGKVNVNKPLLILTTTSGHTVTYCWEGEICPTLTTKCGEAKLVMPDGNIYAVTPEFMGRIQGLPDDYKYPKAKTRAFTIIGNGIPTHLTKAVVGGVLDSAYEQTHDGKVLYSERKIQPITETETKELEKHFGTTGNFNVVGYLLTNGKLLDFSGKHWGDTTSRTRQVDHRDVQEVLGNRESDNGVNAMIDMIGNGNIRLMPEVGGINLAVYPNEKQRNVLSVYINYMLNTEGQIVIDYDSVGGDTVYSKEYGKTATSRQILADIRNYFNGGRQSELMQFHTMDSDRSTDSISNRSLLANALEGVAQNDIERNKLAEYKSKIALIESEQAKLADIRAKIKELSFAKRENRDDEAKRKLQFEEKQIANRINTYDRQLLNLESTKALKGVLEREKQMAYKRAEQRGKDALKAQREKDRERNAKTQRELLTRYQESRKKGIESRNKTEMRYKIKKVVNELNQYLKGTKEKHVPIQLQRPVAEALSIVNMDTVGAEQRIAMKRELMMKAANKGDMDKVNKLSKEIYRIQEMGGNLEEKLAKFKTAYDGILNSEDPLVANAHDEVISKFIDKVIEIVGDTPIRDMSLDELKAVYNMYRMVLTSIRKANKAHASEKSEEISTIANGVIAELKGQNKKSPYTTKAGQVMSAFDWNNLKPVYAFERIGSLNLDKVFNRVLDAEGVWATDMREAEAFRIEQQEKHNFKSFDFEKKYEFFTKTGERFELNLGEIMSLYAWAKDDDAKTHLFGDGFQFDPHKEVVKKTKAGIKVTYNFEDATSYKLSQETLDEIIGVLDEVKGAKEFADAMQDYLANTMGEKGNEVSLELYEIKLFNNKVYFPLKVSHEYLAVAKEKAEGKARVKNKGFTNERTKKAKNTVILSNFMDVWTDHVHEMSMYHAFTLPLEDFRRVIGYSTPSVSEDTSAVSVRGELINAHGKAAAQYIDQLFDDINGGAKGDPRETLAKSFVSRFKKASVVASLSVTAQQPTAIVRAMALVNPKYFVGKKVNKGKIKEKWETMKKYAPVCIIKEMGGFDTGMSMGAVAWLKGEKTFMDKVDDALGWAPEFADKVTWIAIWNAVERETVHKNKNLAPNSEEFRKAVGERFTEVIRKTQVYDSTLSRSANMRSKGLFMTMLTSFMAEPTTSINMLADAFRKIKSNPKYFARTLGAVYGSVLLNSAIVSLIYAMRDDDEDETFAEKYASRVVTEIVDGINPLTYIPGVKDVWSIAQGFDVERADMSLITKVVDSLQQVVRATSKDTSDMDEDELSEHYKAVAEAWMSVGDNITALFGLPVKNFRRDINGIINTFKTFDRDQETTAGSLGDNIAEDLKDSIPVWGWLPDKSKGDKLYDAIKDGDKDYVERLKEYYEYEHFYTAAVEEGPIMAQAVKEVIIQAKVAEGKTIEEAEESFVNGVASVIKRHYDKGDISYYDAIDYLTEFCGKSAEKAKAKVQYWEYKQDNPDADVAEPWFEKYNEEVSSSGISIEMYINYRTKTKGVEGDKDANGNTISGSKKAKIMAIINSLPISNAQKDALYFAEGYTASTLWQAPWH